ncbi:MAG: NADH-quinone oxidoreductase subunit N [Chloroflexi bacterium]|nr:NADH-quinone oxidoreductase subunit N [Chloroflexota bacterium]
MDIAILLLPEIILTIFALIVLGYDLIWPGRKAVLVTLTLVAVGLAAIGAIYTWGTNKTIMADTISIDDYGVLFKLAGLAATAMVVLLGMSYIPEGRRTQDAKRRLLAISRQGEFYAIMLFAAVSIMFLVSANSLVLIYLSIEFLSIASYILVGYLRDDSLSTEAAIKYFLYGSVTAAAMVYGMSFLYGVSGSVDLPTIAKVIAGTLPSPESLRGIVMPAVVLILAGFGFKVAMAPFHQWSPDAYEGAPTPVTAFISVAPKVGGFAVLYRTLIVALPYFHSDWGGTIAILAVLSMSLGNLVALTERNIKRMLAYSSIAQAGYILIGIAAYSQMGISSTLFYVMVYTLTNIGAFAVAIVISNALGSDSIADFAGLSQRNPSLALLMLFFLLSLAGIPPLAGFFGKFFLFTAALEQNLTWLVFVAVINSVLSLYYYLMIVKVMYVDPPESTVPLETPRPLAVAMGISAIAILVLGIFPTPLINLITTAAAALMQVSS